MFLLTLTFKQQRETQSIHPTAEDSELVLAGWAWTRAHIPALD